MAVTSSRADYGIMSELLKCLQKERWLSLFLVVTGTHLSKKHGFTVDEIIADGLEIACQVPFSTSRDSPRRLSASSGELIKAFSRILDDETPDLMLVLGDRIEMLAPVYAATIQKVPVAHVHGGEITEGAIDNKIRDAISCLSDIHFAATEKAASRLRKMLPEKCSIHYVGSLSLDYAMSNKLIAEDRLEKKFGWDLQQGMMLITYHAETMSDMTPVAQVHELISALKEFPDCLQIITAANLDTGGNAINRAFKIYAKNRQNVSIYQSLGHDVYLSCLSCASLIVGNSSSGIIEAPSFGCRTVNIGKRQEGREMAASIVSVPHESAQIAEAISACLSSKKINFLPLEQTPYGKLNAKDEIVNILKRLGSRRL